MTGIEPVMNSARLAGDGRRRRSILSSILFNDLIRSPRASAVDRKGFEKLVTEVGLGHAGIVLGLEV